MSLGDVELEDILKVIWKELRVALICGIVLAAANFAKVMIVDSANIVADGYSPVLIALVVSLALGLTVVIAKFIGCVLPMLAKKIGFDPAVMASPLITTIVDAVSLMVFFNIAVMVLHI